MEGGLPREEREGGLRSVGGAAASQPGGLAPPTGSRRYFKPIPLLPRKPGGMGVGLGGQLLVNFPANQNAACKELAVRTRQVEICITRSRAAYRMQRRDSYLEEKRLQASSYNLRIDFTS